MPLPSAFPHVSFSPRFSTRVYHAHEHIGKAAALPVINAVFALPTAAGSW